MITSTRLASVDPLFRNKTFFFALWNQRIRRERQVTEGIVLTDAARLGIFRFFDGWNPANYDRVETQTPTNLYNPYRARGGYFRQSGPAQIQCHWDPVQWSRTSVSQRIRHSETRPNREHGSVYQQRLSGWYCPLILRLGLWRGIRFVLSLILRALSSELP